MNTILTSVNDVREALATIAEAARDLRAQLPGFRTEIRRTATELEQGGQDMAAAGAALVQAG